MAVYVLDKRKNPLMPCSEKRARLLLRRGRAVVVRVYPFTIRLKDRIGGRCQPVRLKLDPGSRTTGLALVREDGDTQHVLWLGELDHRGQAIRDALSQRRAFRRRRRSANLRYRARRFDNRRRSSGWLPPSLRHRVETIAAWVARLRRWVPVTGISLELVRFDTQALQTPDIKGVEYQHGTLFGYELREYLLEKWGRRCAYCGKENVPLEIEHIHPKSRGGSDRVSNLTLACRRCNEAKGNRPVEAFLADRPEVLTRILTQAKAPLHDGAAGRDWEWRPDEVEPLAAGNPQDVCPGCGLRRKDRGIGRLAAAGSLYQSDWPRRLSTDTPGPVRFPARVSPAPEAGTRVSDWGPGPCRGAGWEKSRSVCRPRGGPRQRIVQHSNARWDRTRDSCPVLHANPAGGRVWVCSSTKDST
jgi:5-methylcytosine-specific restriction endonuclease McrA